MIPTPEIEGTDALMRQCHAFTRYLTGGDPSPYVIRKYVDLAVKSNSADESAAAIDTKLLKSASRGGASTRIADSYARIFRPGGLLRRRLILLCAILENSPGVHRQFTGGASDSRYAYVRICLALAAFATTLSIGVLAFGPIQLFSRLRATGNRR